jgi:MFS family permease
MSHPRSHDANPYAAWRSSNYRCYAIGWFLLTFGNQVGTVAVGIHLYNQTRDALVLGIVGLVQALPVMLLAIAAGQLADRFDRRRVMMTMLGAGTLVSLSLAVASWANASPSWFYLLLGLGAVSQALGGPARAAMLPSIVEPHVFNNAMTWSTSIFQISMMTGPVVGGFLVSWDPTATIAFLVVALCRLLSVAAVAVLRCRPMERDAEAVSLRSLLAGIRFVGAQKVILAAISLDMFAVLLGGATYLLPVFTRDILCLEAHEAAVGVFRSAEAIGAVTMAMIIAHAPPMQHAGRTLLWAVAGFGGATIVFGLSGSFWLSLAMMFLIGALDNVSVVVRHTLVQMLTPDAMRGRVSAVNGVFITASNDLGGFESGVTARLFGPVVSVVAGGIGTILVVLTSAQVFPQLRAVGSLRDIRPVELEEAERESVGEAGQT